MNVVFFACGFIAIVFVLFISVYLIISGIPAIREIGLIDFLFGTEWASTAAEPKFGILPFILTSIYGTAGAIVLGVPVGFMTAVFLAKVAPPRLAAVVRPAVDLLAGIPSVVYGLIGMMVLVPAVRVAFNLPDGASLFWPSRRCPRSMRRPPWLWAPPTSRPCSGCPSPRPPAASPPPSCWASAGPSARPWPSSWWPATCGQHARAVQVRPLPHHRRGQRDVLRLRPPAAGPVLHRSGSLSLHYAYQCGSQHASQTEEGVIY